MQLVITFMAVVAGLIFSVAVALLAEEFIFGQVFRLFFARQGVRQSIRQMVPQTLPAKIGQKR
jgi:ABC-type enterobactin transport system permease subunit